jgi:CheY-like chemotaxis protein
MITNEIIRVLLADDDKDDRTDFIEAFESLKIKTTVQTVNNGVELMKYLNEPTAVIPHLLFLDLNMPKKSGLECLKEIKKNDKLSNLTVVIYSTSSSEKDMEDTFLNGANVYIKKPAHLTMLKKTLLHVLTINWHYHTSGLNRENFLLHL